MQFRTSLALCIALAARTTAAAPPDDWAPSTGKEMPVAPPAPPETRDPKALEAALAADVAAADAARDKAACNKVIAPLARAIDSAHLPVDKARPAWSALARCARIANRFQLLGAIARAAPTAVMPSDLAAALIGQERYPEAGAELKTQLAHAPRDPFLLDTAARLACRQEDFARCRTAADQALTAARASKAPDAAVAAQVANVEIWLSSTMLGDYAAAHHALDALATNPAHDGLARLLVPAERAHLGVDVKPPRSLPLGTYHLAGKANRPLLALTFGNGLAKDRELRVSVGIPGVTEPAVKTVVVLAKKVERVAFTPTLLPAFSIDSISSPRQVQLDVKVTEGADAVFEESYALDLLPRDYLPMFEKVSDDTVRPVKENMGAWVTPNDPAVEKLLTAAKARLVGHQSFSGPQQATLPQVQAIYDELKARGVSYVMDPDIGTDQFLGQRTRLPAEIIASTNAQCLEGTLLFASALESIGLDAVIVLVPHHAFIGWHGSPSDSKAPALYFVETTMVHTASFEDAVRVAVARVKEEDKEGHFKSGLAQLVEVKDLRARGITPQPTYAGAH